MAKIKANGTHEVARYRHPEGGTQYLVRSDGVVLQKWGVEGSGWKIEAYMTQSLKRQYKNAEDRVAGALRWLDGTFDLVRVK